MSVRLQALAFCATMKITTSGSNVLSVFETVCAATVPWLIHDITLDKWPLQRNCVTWKIVIGDSSGRVHMPTTWGTRDVPTTHRPNTVCISGFVADSKTVAITTRCTEGVCVSAIGAWSDR